MKWEDAKKQTFGVEVEMAGIRRRSAATIAAGYFGTGNFRYTGSHSEDGYETWSAWDDLGRKWKFAKDVSIVARNDEEKCELVTPVLTYDEDIELLLGLIRELRKAGGISCPQTGCGVHIHIGADAEEPGGHTGRSLRNLINLMASHEDLLEKAVGIDRSRMNHYCKKVEASFLEELNKQKPDSVRGVQELMYKSEGEAFPTGNPNLGYNHYRQSRYHMLNLHSLYRTHTVEFRLFQFDNPTAEKKNGLHAGMLRAYIQLALCMSEFAKASRTIKAAKVQSDNDKFAMRTWMNRMDMIGPEFATAREIFGRKLTGDAAFRYGRNGDL